MPGYAWPYHMALTVGLLLVATQLLLIRPSWRRLQHAVQSAEKPEAESARRRVAMSAGIGQLLWLILLVLMFWGQLVNAATA